MLGAVADNVQADESAWDGEQDGDADIDGGEGLQGRETSAEQWLLCWKRLVGYTLPSGLFDNEFFQFRGGDVQPAEETAEVTIVAELQAEIADAV